MRGKPGVRAQGSGNLDANKELGQKVAEHEAMIREREIKKNRRRRKINFFFFGLKRIRRGDMCASCMIVR